MAPDAWFATTSTWTAACHRRLTWPGALHSLFCFYFYQSWTYTDMLFVVVVVVVFFQLVI